MHMCDFTACVYMSLHTSGARVVPCIAGLPTGQLPYQHLSNSDAAKAICAGDKLTKPNGCNPEL